MFEMVRSSVVLFFQGKLFHEPGKVMRLGAICAGLSALIIIVLAQIGVPWIAAAAVGGFSGGALQPYLFKNLRYR